MQQNVTWSSLFAQMIKAIEKYQEGDELRKGKKLCTTSLYPSK
jgi:hypothetical protein